VQRRRNRQRKDTADVHGSKITNKAFDKASESIPVHGYDEPEDRLASYDELMNPEGTIGAGYLEPQKGSLEYAVSHGAEKSLDAYLEPVEGVGLEYAATQGYSEPADSTPDYSDPTEASLEYASTKGAESAEYEQPVPGSRDDAAYAEVRQGKDDATYARVLKPGKTAPPLSDKRRSKWPSEFMQQDYSTASSSAAGLYSEAVSAPVYSEAQSLSPVKTDPDYATASPRDRSEATYDTASAQSAEATSTEIPVYNTASGGHVEDTVYAMAAACDPTDTDCHHAVYDTAARGECEHVKDGSDSTASPRGFKGRKASVYGGFADSSSDAIASEHDHKGELNEQGTMDPDAAFNPIYDAATLPVGVSLEASGDQDGYLDIETDVVAAEFVEATDMC